MYFVHIYGLHVYCALVDLDSSGSPGVRRTSGLTSSIQAVCVCVRAYTNKHPPTTLTPAKIKKYTRQNPLSLPPQNHSLPCQGEACLKFLMRRHTYDSCTCVSGITYNSLKFWKNCTSNASFLRRLETWNMSPKTPKTHSPQLMYLLQKNLANA